MNSNRAKYLQTIILLDEIQQFHHEFSEGIPDTIAFFRKLNFNILILYKFKCFLSSINRDLKDNKQFNDSKRAIYEELDFINHIRNKISGHFDTSAMKKAAQWEPFIFYENITNERLRVMFAYKSLFDTAINSYLDRHGENPIYHKELDLNLSEERNLFLETIKQLNESSIRILKIIRNHFENSDIMIGKGEEYSAAKIAGQTDFNLKSDSSEKNQNISLSPLIEEEFIKSLDFSNVDDLNHLIDKIEELIKNYS